MYRGCGIGRLLAARVVEAARAAGAREVVVRPVGRNAGAIRAFHGLGFDVLSRVELLLSPSDRWRPGERIADRDFRV